MAKNQELRLLDVLEDLCCREFKIFKWFLLHESKHGRIPRCYLEDANRMTTVDQIVQVYGPRAVEISVNILGSMAQHHLVLRLTEVTSAAKVKTTTYQVQTNITATHGGNVIAPNIKDCKFNNLNITITSQGAVCGHVAEQLCQTFVPPPERPLCVFPPLLSGVLNDLSGRVDADDLFLLSLKEQLKHLEPQRKSQVKLEIQRMIHDACFGSDAHRNTHELRRRRLRPRTQVRVAGAAALAEQPRQPSPHPLPPALPGEPRGVLRPVHTQNPSSVSWVGPEVSSRMDTPKTPLQGDVQEASSLNVQTTSIGSSGCEGAAASLPDVGAPPPISKAEPDHPAKKARFSCLYPQHHSFGHYPELVTIDEGQSVGQPINQDLCLLTQLPFHHNGPVLGPHHYRHRPDPPVDPP